MNAENVVSPTTAGSDVERIVMRKLGRAQRGVLECLTRSEWCTTGFNYWAWDTHSGTIKILESLRKRDLVNLDKGRYSITDKGRELLA